jgi:plasmid stabilization system protein ParE
MPYRVEFAPDAESQLAAIYHYIAHKAAADVALR